VAERDRHATVAALPSSAMDGPARGARTVAWWEAQLPAIERRMREFLGRRLPTLRQQHDDLVNESLAAMTERVKREPTLHPRSWYVPEGPVDEAERAYLDRLAMAILRRRIADMFRQRARHWGDRDDDSAIDLAVAGDPSPDRAATLARMLRICVATLAEMSDEDRELITAQSNRDAGSVARALTDRERQRLRRARARLTEAIRDRMGADVDDLLAPED
jgi:hypothetical protein